MTLPGTRPSRSRHGCLTCRDSKVKCDEEHPICKRCTRLGLDCSYAARPRKKYTRRVVIASPDGEVVADATTDASPVTQGSSVHSSRAHLSPSRCSNASESGPTPSGQSIDQGSTAASPLNPGAALGASLSPACVRILSPSDYAAIRCFRMEVAAEVDTKTPAYGGPALLWVLAEKDPMVLHMVCALGGRRLNFDGSMPVEDARYQRSQAVEHYGAALRLLAHATQEFEEHSELDYVMATLWLMIAYEHKYEDGCGVGLSTHLRGAASLLRGRMGVIRSLVNQDEASLSGQDGPNTEFEDGPRHDDLSLLASRIIIWIALIDGGAALNGLGAAFNDLLEEAMFSMNEYSALPRTRAFATLQRRSDLVCQSCFGSYPQSELIEDLEGSQIFCLYAEAGQLRYLLSKLRVTDQVPGSGSVSQSEVFAKGLREVEARYGELLSIASRLELPGPGLPQRRFVMNLRYVASFYHAVVLCFFRTTNGAVPLSSKQRKALREIMNMAFKAYHDEGEPAMIRVAWPLFVAALESDEILHRTWIQERYDALSNKGENFRRARNALRVAFREQRLDERRVNYADLVARSDVDPFVI